MKNSIAHINSDKEIQSVETHCKNVANYAMKEARLLNLSNTLYLAGMLHDIGKFSNDFKEYIIAANNAPGSVNKGSVNHSSAGGYYINSLLPDTNKFSIFTKQLISYAIISHHGLTDCITPDGLDAYTRRLQLQKENNYVDIIKDTEKFISKEKIQNYFQLANMEITEVSNYLYSLSKEMSTNKKNIFPYLLGSLERLILSILMDSDRRDTAEFMEKATFHRLSNDELSDLWIKYDNRFKEYMSSFKRDSYINTLRSDISDIAYKSAFNGDGIYRLTVPTGGGKTLTSLRYAITLAKETNKQHIIYVAPYLSILEQNAMVFEDVLKDKDNVLEHHSDMIIDEEDQERLNKYELLCEDWSSPVILTTMVQFLNVLFSGKSKDIRRMHQLKNSVIIVDEAQSIPIKTINMFNGMVDFLNKFCHSTFVMCTATQPLFDITGCKMLYSQNADIIPNYNDYFNKFKRVEIQNAIVKGSYSTEELADFIVDKLDRSILVIVNTKNAVKMIYDELNKRVLNDYHIIQLTTYMCAAHRIDTINALKKMLHTEKVICISTQLIEAGVDISFQCVVRSLTGIDSLAQAAGRCNRNAETDLGKVYLVNYKDENTSRMEEIDLAKNSTMLVLDKFKGDILSDNMIRRYYEQYFGTQCSKMDFTIKDNPPLFEMLSNNKTFKGDYQGRYGKSYPYILAQSFKTAGKYFEVIPNQNVIGIITPYKDAKTDIEALKNAKQLSDQKKILKRLQRYTVNVFNTDKLLKKLHERHAFSRSLFNGAILVLDDAFYKKEGLSDDLDLLDF